MKKLILLLTFTVLTFSLNSCSNDDNSESAKGSVVATINGVTKTYEKFSIKQDTYTDEDGSKVTELAIIARMKSSSGETIVFGLNKGAIGADEIWSLDCGTNNATFNKNDDFTTNVEINDGTKLKGTFSGSLTSSIAGTIEIKNGSFDISY